jgi:uncharacterized membrane protein YdjX (TVP38/TMEM64 family)
MNSKSRTADWRLALGALALGLVLVGVFTLPIEQWLGSARVWQATHPVSAALLYVAGVVVATPMMVPGSLLMMSGGFIFGLVVGAALACVGITIGATLACLAGRGLARPIVESYTQGNAQFKALNAALEQRGFLVVVLSRLSLLIPYNMLNYAYGITGIRMSTYVAATGLGMVPGIILFAYLGSLASDVNALLSTDAGSGATGRVVLIVSLLAIGTASYVIHRTATRELKKQMAGNTSDLQG